MDIIFELKGRIIHNINMFNICILKINATESKSYYVMAKNKSGPMINCEVQIKIKHVYTFKYDSCEIKLYQEISN